MHFPLTTSRLSIAPLQLADLDTFVQYRQDPDIAKYQGWETSYSKSQGQALIESQRDMLFPAAGDWLQLAIHKLDSREHIGDLALHCLVDEPQAFEIGFTVAKSHQGQGYAKEAVSKLIEFLFSDQRANKVIAQPDQRNLQSIRLLESLGFHERTENAWSEIFKGEFVTVKYFELIKAARS